MITGRYFVFYEIVNEYPHLLKLENFLFISHVPPATGYIGIGACDQVFLTSYMNTIYKKTLRLSGYPSLDFRPSAKKSS